MGPILKVVQQGSEHGSCHYCQKGELKEDGMGLKYPYKEMVQLEGTYLSSNICYECFGKVLEFGLVLPKASESTELPSEAEAE
ncbi:hypothetical protein [Paenibacillus apii]|uniref:hypothetical protein n=1 Tax=Paenibacillus apii TaxID=1850370 RepID=UPI00143B2F2C|nr:hypothetical protein [Paenibacillus apii]NJJ38565.1 hypothetical protein [Paenibacillus apii]